jgi:hypothetical protein
MVLPGAEVTEGGSKMLECDEVISSRNVGCSQHPFSERRVVGIIGFESNLFASGGDIKRTLNVTVQTVIYEEPIQKPHLVGKVSLYGCHGKRPRKTLANALAVAAICMHQRE